MVEPKANAVCEVSWEVCNKVGGIYTVVASKAAEMTKRYGDNYFLIGPYFPAKAAGIFEETVPPEQCKECFEDLKKEGIDVHTGIWLVKGSPKVLLIDFSNYTKNTNEIKKKLWETYGIDSLGTDYYDFDEPVVWSWAAGRVIEEMQHVWKKGTVAQFHEWLAGAGILYLKMNKIPVATVFTTHATTIGRALASADINIYQLLDRINADEEARKRGPGCWAKHLLEKACAKNTSVFTTVSEITGIEAEKFLERKPDLLLFNGLDMDKFPTFEQASLRHRIFRARIKEFLLYYYFPYQKFDLENTLLYFIAGRYEFRDKGIDIYIKALAELNERLKKQKDSKTIVAFVFVPGNIRAIRPQLLENKTAYMDIRDSVEDIKEEVKTRLLYLLTSQAPITNESLLDPEFRQEIKPKLKKFLSRKGYPPISTHELYDEDKDPIMRTLWDSGLDNSPDDKVKVVFYPIYLSGADGLLDTSYYETMQGCHLGVFPSYYEPWGYTPLEAAALGVSSVTTDLAGFGRYIYSECKQGKYPGIFVLKRFGRIDADIIKDLADMMEIYSKFTTHERVENKIMAQRVAATADWKFFADRYVEAHNLALDRA
ncbi:MAG: glycogen/starch synthase [Candidatus Woesearchaeota archaeon]